VPCEDGPAFLPDAMIGLLRQAIVRSPRAQPLMFELSGILMRAGHEQEAAELFRRAYLSGPSAVDNTMFVPAPGTDARTLHRRARSLIGHGVTFSPVIAALAIAEVMLNHPDKARQLVDYDRFCRRYEVATPEACRDLDFNAGLAAEIKADLTFSGDTLQRSTRRSWRNNNVLGAASPTCRALAATVQQLVKQYIAELPDDPGHPFVASRPDSFVLKGWAVVSNGPGYLQPHLHPRAWLSAVYYVTQPPISQQPGSHEGWLRLGLPDTYGLSAADGWDERWFEPRLGTLLLMPSYFLHGTSPMAQNDERISIAFDIVTAEVAAAYECAVHQGHYFG
jgi:hypothetical protein